MIDQHEFSYLTNIIYSENIDIIKNYLTYTSQNTLIVSSYNMNSYYHLISFGELSI